MPEPVTWLLIFGLTARTTRLVTDDTITGGVRAWFIRKFDRDSIWATFPACPWCVSLWVAPAAVWFGLEYGDTWWFLIPALAATISWLYSLSAMWLDKE